MTQNEQVRECLENSKKLTSLTAIREFGITRLAARVKDLREMGVPVTSRKVAVKNRSGKDVYVSEYSLNQNITQEELAI